MKYIALMLILVSNCSTLAGDISPLTIDASDNWKVSYNKEVNFYTITNQSNNGSSKLFFGFFPPVSKDDILDNVEKIAQGVSEEINNSFWVRFLNWLMGSNFNNSFVMHEIVGKEYSGHYAEFKLYESVHIVFIFGNDSEAWSGQFMGIKEMSKEAMNIIKNIKKSG